MNKLLLITFLFVSLSSLAGEKIDQSLDVEPQGEVSIGNIRGEITLSGWDKNKIVVKGELDDATEKFTFTSKEGKTLIKVELLNSTRHYEKGKGSRLTILVPMDVLVQFNGVSTHLIFSKIKGGIEINSVSGDLELTDIAKRVYINSVNGKLTLKKISANIEISTVSGDLDATLSSKKILVEGVSSNLTIKTGKIESASVSSVSGDINIYGQLQGNGKINLRSVSGDSYFHVKGDLNSQIALDTGPGGSVVNQYSEDKASRSFIHAEKLKFIAGDGNGRVKMSTVSGHIGLKRKK